MKDEIAVLAEAIKGLTEAISKIGIVPKEVKSNSRENPKSPPAKEEKSIPKISFEDLRAVLAVLTRDGKQQEVKELITGYGAKKLSDVPEDRYQELLDAARKI